MKFIERHLNLIGILMLTSFAAAAAGLYFDMPGKISYARAKAVAQQFTCPMHPQIVRNATGECPECGMKLVALRPGVEPPAIESKGSCCGGHGATSETPAATCPHMAGGTSAPSCPAHSHP
jgi:hypothetical protein